MIYLLLSILSSTCIFILFKSFDRYKINTLQAIVLNYITASTSGFLFASNSVELNSIVSRPWFKPAIGLGVLFITMFYLMALTAQKNGLSVASVASKMSVIIPIIFGVFVFNESLGIIKFIGIVLALVAVYLTSTGSKIRNRTNKALYLLPVLVFFGSGIIDTSINYFAPDDNIPIFSATIFGMAGLIGILLVIINYFSYQKIIDLKVIPFGVCLGIVNYGSIYFLLKALRVQGVESSSIFTINNVGIVALSSLCGLFLFKEIITIKNWLGISCAVISIIIVSLL